MSHHPATPRTRILIASYYFPPDAAVGGLRASKFARTLREFGWEPSVLTVRDEYRERFDRSRLKDLEGIPITATHKFPSVAECYGFIKRSVRRVLRRPAAAIVSGARLAPLATPAEPGHSGVRETLRGRLKRYVVSLVFQLPDQQKEWALYAAVKAVWLVRARKIDYVLTSSPPESIHAIGLAVKAFTHATWIADFRDPWYEGGIEDRPLATRSWLSDAIERWMEWLVVRHADRVITTNARLRELLQRQYPEMPAERFACVPNSIDTEKFDVPAAVEKYRELTITYAGTFYFNRTPEPLFRAVSELIEEGRVHEREIRIKLVGNCERIGTADTRAVADAYGLQSVVEVLEPVPYAEAIRIMQRSHLLLVLAPPNHLLAVPAKLYDYLGSGSKVLAIAEAGATSDLMTDTNSGHCFSHADIAGLKDYLAGLTTDGRFSALRNDPRAFERYDVRHLTRRLASEMLACRRTGGVAPCYQ